MSRWRGLSLRQAIGKYIPRTRKDWGWVAVSFSLTFATSMLVLVVLYELMRPTDTPSQAVPPVTMTQVVVVPSEVTVLVQPTSSRKPVEQVRISSPAAPKPSASATSGVTTTTPVAPQLSPTATPSATKPSSSASGVETSVPATEIPSSSTAQASPSQ